MKFIHSGKMSADMIMQKDAYLLSELSSTSEPTLHLYEWDSPSATYGCFTKPENYLNMDNVLASGLTLAKRPTGGGIVFHLCDFAFSFLLPAHHRQFSMNTLDNYALVNKAVINAIQKLNKDMTPLLLPEESPPLDLHCSKFCMAKPTIYDVIIQGKKIGGAAQRRTKQGLLHQGTIAVALLSNEYLEKILLPKTKVLEAMQKNSVSLLKNNWTSEELQKMRMDVSLALQAAFKELIS